MRQLVRRLVALLSVLAVAAAISPMSAASAAPPVPKVPDYGTQIDAYSKYEAETQCLYPQVQPGVLKMRDLIKATYGSYASSAYDFHTTRYCSGSGSSGHHEGRALDWMLNASNTAEREVADSYLAWLLATDKYGNKHAMARRMGVMYIIWNKKVFGLYRPADGWQPYTGSSPHTDHIHLSLSWAGAGAQTSFYTGAAPTSPGCTPGAPDCPVDRVSGATKFDTSVAIGKETFPGSKTVVIVSSDEGRRADGAVAAPFAYRKQAPVLLSTRDGLSSAVLQDLGRRGATQAYLVGGPMGLSTAIEQQLEAVGVASTRLAGQTRYETAALVARAMDHRPWAAFVASGNDHNLIDALAAGGIGARNAWPVLLTERDQLPGQTESALTELGVSRTYVVGGTIPISDTVVGQVPDGRRIAGSTLYDTAAQLATTFASSVGTERLVIASGDRYNIIDALAGGTFGNLTLLTEQARLTPVTGTWVEARGVESAVIVGGPLAVSDTAGRQLAEVLLR